MLDPKPKKLGDLTEPNDSLEETDGKKSENFNSDD